MSSSDFQRYQISSKLAFILVSFSLGSLGDGLNPFQAIYLNCIGWNESSIGIALSIMGLSSLLIQTLAGDLIDKTDWDRRYFLGISSLVSGISASAILLVQKGTNQDHGIIYVSKMIQGISTVFIGPSLAAVTLSTFGPNHFDPTMASNLFWNHIGGFCSAVLAGVVAYISYPNIQYCFLVIGVSAVIAVGSVVFLPVGDPLMGRGFHGKREHLMDESQAPSSSPSSSSSSPPSSPPPPLSLSLSTRSLSKGVQGKIGTGLDPNLDHSSSQEAATYWSVFTDPATAVFSVTCFFFHFANASVLITLGELMANGGNNNDDNNNNNDDDNESINRSAIPLTSGAVVSAQITMALITIIGDHLTKRGFKRKPLLMIGLCSLPIRCLLILYLYNWVHASELWLMSTQVLDGVGAGFHGLLVPYLVADITFGTGRFNVVNGFVGTLSGIGGLLSNLIGQSLVENYGYNASLSGSLCLSIMACIVFGCFMPETFGLRGTIGDNLTNPHVVKGEGDVEMT